MANTTLNIKWLFYQHFPNLKIKKYTAEEMYKITKVTFLFNSNWINVT